MAQVTLNKERIDSLSEEENLKKEIKQDEKLLGNMTLAELIHDMANEFVQMIQEIISLPGQLTPNLPLEFLAVFVKGNRLIYIGIVVMFAGMFSMFANKGGAPL